MIFYKSTAHFYTMQEIFEIMYEAAIFWVEMAIFYDELNYIALDKCSENQYFFLIFELQVSIHRK